MKKRLKEIGRRIPRLSRPWRVARNGLCILLLICICWIFAGRPAFNDVMQFRLAERQYMVGPAEILGTYDVPEGFYFTRLTVGESQHGVSFFPNRDLRPNEFASRLRLYYREKMGAASLYCVPVDQWPRSGEPFDALWLLLSEVNAARAEVDLTLTGREVSGEKRYEKTYFLSGEAGEGGVFLLPLSVDRVEDEIEEDLLHRVTEFDDYGGPNPWYGPIYADVRLYSAGGTLLLEQRLWLVEAME